MRLQASCNIPRSDLFFLTLSNFEGTFLRCTLTTEQRKEEEKQGNRGRALKKGTLRKQLWKLKIRVKTISKTTSVEPA